jgi:hypothetical protein
METIRQFKKMSLWDFIELMERNCYESGAKATDFLDLAELRMRKIEAVSEGGNYKLQSLARELRDQLRAEVEKNPEFITEADQNDFEFIVKEITG